MIFSFSFHGKLYFVKYILHSLKDVFLYSTNAIHYSINLINCMINLALYTIHLILHRILSFLLDQSHCLLSKYHSQQNRHRILLDTCHSKQC